MNGINSLYLLIYVPLLKYDGYSFQLIPFSKSISFLSTVFTPIKILCEKTGLSKERFFTQNLGFENIEELEQGKIQLSVDQLQKACDLFNLSLKDLTDESLDELELVNFFNFSTMANADLLGIAAINKIAQNLKEMNAILTAGTMS